MLSTCTILEINFKPEKFLINIFPICQCIVDWIEHVRQRDKSCAIKKEIKISCSHYINSI